MTKNNLDKYRQERRDRVKHVILKCLGCGMEVVVPRFMVPEALQRTCKDCFETHGKVYKFRRK